MRPQKTLYHLGGGQKPLTLTQIVVRLSGPDASGVAEACVYIFALSERVVSRGRSATVHDPEFKVAFLTAAEKAGLVALCTRALKWGGLTATWASEALGKLCDLMVPTAAREYVKRGHAAFIESGGPEALVGLMAMPVQQQAFGRVWSITTAAGYAVSLFWQLSFSSPVRARCVEVGIVPAFVRLLATAPRLAKLDADASSVTHYTRPDIVCIIATNMWEDGDVFGGAKKAVLPAVLQQFVDAGFAPILVAMLEASFDEPPPG